MVTALRRVQLRIERSGERQGVTYPWWIPASSSSITVAVAVAAWWQHGGVDASVATHLALALAVGPIAGWVLSARLLPPLVEAAFILASVCLFLTHPVTPDLAPVLLFMITGEVAAVSRLWLAVTVAAAGTVAVLSAGLLGQLSYAVLYAIGVVFAADIGIALRWQMRALRAERRNTRFAEESAISAERQRLAREVHDVVGHALSINLLHVTAARHALQRHADIADAIESLVEAERVGRTAMGDLRRTVAVLAAAPGETHALPGVADVAGLVERSRAAGLDVGYRQDGDIAWLDEATGLGLFRIVQESLANIARHAPAATATVTLVEQAAGVRLTVRNTLPDGPSDTVTGGAGLPGMAARAELLGATLRAGVDGEHWLVEVVVPVARDRPARTTVSA